MRSKNFEILGFHSHKNTWYPNTFSLPIVKSVELKERNNNELKELLDHLWCTKEMSRGEESCLLVRFISFMCYFWHEPLQFNDGISCWNFMMKKGFWELVHPKSIKLFHKSWLSLMKTENKANQTIIFLIQTIVFKNKWFYFL